MLSDVDFRIGSGHSKTDASGVAFIGRLGDGNRANLTADRESLPDIALAPVNEGIEVVPRAGRVHVTDYAVQELSDIEGTAFFSEGGSLGREVSGLHLQLVDAAGKADCPRPDRRRRHLLFRTGPAGQPIRSGSIRTRPPASRST